MMGRLNFGQNVGPLLWHVLLYVELKGPVEEVEVLVGNLATSRDVVHRNERLIEV